MNLNATHKTSVRMQENDVSSSCKNEHPINTISYASPFDINHNLKKHELQNEHDPLKRSLPKKNYENREPFDFTNFVRATAPSSPILYHNPTNNENNEIPFIFGSTSKSHNDEKEHGVQDPVATPFPNLVSISTLDIEPNTSLPCKKKNTVPFVSMDHDRRKRRRMTMEDAFANFLSMNHHNDHTTSTTNQNRTMLVDPEMQLSSLDLIMTPERDISTPMASAAATTADATPMEYSHISKKLEFSEGMLDGASPLTMNTKAMYRQTSNGTYSNSFELDAELDQIDDDLTMNEKHIDNEDNDNHSEISLSSTTSSSNHSNGLSLLYAPKKHKGQNAKPMDPVDERIEELIRHSRIKAMMITNRDMKRDLQQRGQRDKSGSVSSSMEHEFNQHGVTHDVDIVSALFGQKRKKLQMENHQDNDNGIAQDVYSNRYYNDGQIHKPHPLTGKVLRFGSIESATMEEWNSFSSPSKLSRVNSSLDKTDTSNLAIISNRSRSNSIPSTMKLSHVEEEESLEME